jgi:hypothetical protein
MSEMNQGFVSLPISSTFLIYTEACVDVDDESPSLGGLQELFPDRAAVGRAAGASTARRQPPSGWSGTDWWQEIEAVCLARAPKALDPFDPARSVPAVAFLPVRAHYSWNLVSPWTFRSAQVQRDGPRD